MTTSAQTGRSTGTPSDRPWHAVTWLVWALAGAAAVQLASSPVYVLLVIAISGLVVSAYGLEGSFARAFPTLRRASAVAFAVLRVVLTALTTHGGPDVIFTTPGFTLPDLLGGFTVGGSDRSCRSSCRPPTKAS